MYATRPQCYITTATKLKALTHDRVKQIPI